MFKIIPYNIWIFTKYEETVKYILTEVCQFLLMFTFHQFVIIETSPKFENSHRRAYLYTTAIYTYLNPCQIFPELVACLLHMTYPRQKQCLSELLVNVFSVGHEDRREKHITTDGGHLALEGVTFSFSHLPCWTGEPCSGQPDIDGRE